MKKWQMTLTSREDKELLDYQHLKLYKILHKIVKSYRKPDTGIVNGELSGQFIDLLRSHHEREARILQVLQPDGWRAHIESHLKVMCSASELKAHSEDGDSPEHAELKLLLKNLKQHVKLIDLRLRYGR